MPQFPQTPSTQGQGLAGSALGGQGIPQEVLPAGGVPDDEALSMVIQMLKNGQVGAEKLLQALSLLASSTVQGIGGPGQQQAPQGPQQGGPPPSITDLLG